MVRPWTLNWKLTAEVGYDWDYFTFPSLVTTEMIPQENGTFELVIVVRHFFLKGLYGTFKHSFTSVQHFLYTGRSEHASWRDSFIRNLRPYSPTSDEAGILEDFRADGRSDHAQHRRKGRCPSVSSLIELMIGHARQILALLVTTRFLIMHPAY